MKVTFITLSDQQFQIMEGFSDQERWAIAGPAGSGKTVLAVEQARRLSLSAKTPVLFCCFNAPLASCIGAKLRDCAGVDVRTFHQLCIEHGADPKLISTAGAQISECLKDSAKEYRVIIVDEGQDFQPAWWPNLESLLEQNGQLFVFFDDRQKLYEIPSNFIKGMSKCPFNLSRNLRNTKQVFKVAQAWIPGLPRVSSWGPDGPEVAWVSCDDVGSLNSICNVLHRLVEIERINPRDIAVLCTGTQGINQLKQGNKICKLMAHDADTQDRPGITVESIRRFKGLESRVVVLALTEDTVPEGELLYVGLTRARSYLAIVGKAAVLNSLKLSASASDGLAAALLKT